MAGVIQDMVDFAKTVGVGVKKKITGEDVTAGKNAPPLTTQQIRNKGNETLNTPVTPDEVEQKKKMGNK